MDNLTLKVLMKSNHSFYISITINVQSSWFCFLRGCIICGLYKMNNSDYTNIICKHGGATMAEAERVFTAGQWNINSYLRATMCTNFEPAFGSYTNYLSSSLILKYFFKWPFPKNQLNHMTVSTWSNRPIFQSKFRFCILNGNWKFRSTIYSYLIELIFFRVTRKNIWKLINEDHLFKIQK